MNEKVYQLAHSLTEEHFYKNMMDVMGEKTIDGYMYVKGGNDGFPHTRAHVKIDLKTNRIIEYYGAHDCPVYVGEGVYE